MIITTIYKYGFVYSNVKYVWKDKKLYRLPYTKEKRSYGFMEVPFYCFKSTLVCNIQRVKMTLNKLKSMTIEINESFETIEDNNLPF
jgi:hypothetical protein